MKKLLKWTVLNCEGYTFINWPMTEGPISRALAYANRKIKLKDKAPPRGGVNCVCEQILVVVAISNMRDIMADEKKGYIRTLIDYMLVDPKGTGVGQDRPRLRLRRRPKGKCINIYIPLPHHPMGLASLDAMAT